MTLNTLYRPPLSDRWIEIAAWIEREDPDVVCLQEVHHQPDGSTVADWLVDRCRTLVDAVFGGRVEARSGRPFGTAVLSRWSIDASECVDLPGDDPAPKVVLHARTAGIDVYSVHLTADPAAAPVRDRQALLVDDTIRRTADPDSPLPPVLAGDLNAPPTASAVAFLRGEVSLAGRGTFYQDAWTVAGDGPGHTWDHRNPLTPPAYLMDARCDYVLVGMPKVPIGWSTGASAELAPAGQVTAAHLVCHEPLTGTLASDHYGVVAELCWPSRPATA
jgi:endonuclease/exonuclease/phosphatase family metal-dependent hydrolase